MASLWAGRCRRLRAIGAAALLATLCRTSALAAPDDKDKAKNAAASDSSSVLSREDVRVANEVLKDLQQLSASVQNEKAPERKASIGDILKALHRPERHTSKTSLSPAEIDAQIEKTFADAKGQAAKLMGDEEFVRRITLDVTGKLPTPEQVLGFVRGKEKNKRALLVDYLLASPDYAKNWARYWRDVIRYRATNENIAQIRYPELESWLEEKFKKNVPWDEIVSELITATGRNDENGATIFSLAHMGQAVEVAGEVSRIFMGVQIQCAQCHDHPNDPWKREQFHQFAAFFAGTAVRRTGMPMPGQGPPPFEVINQRNARYGMPDLKDPQKSIPVQPKFFLVSDKTETPKDLSPAQRKALVASYVTGQDNLWFAKAFVNRVWYSLMGEGFYNPVDDLGPARSATAPEVIESLAKAWQDGGYDVRWLFRTILNTKTYQREFRPSSTTAGKTPFAANCPSRLRADQIVDALEQALGMPLDNPGPPPGAAGKAAAKKAQQAAGAGALIRRLGLNTPRARLNALFGVDPSTPNDDVLGTIPQALFMMNSPEVNRAIQADKGRVLGEILSSTPDNRMALEALYLKVLARRPTHKEVEVCGHYLMSAGNRREGFEDILWALINSTEFISRR
jgi:hypothetical protein